MYAWSPRSPNMTLHGAGLWLFSPLRKANSTGLVVSISKPAFAGSIRGFCGRRCEPIRAMFTHAEAVEKTVEEDDHRRLPVRALPSPPWRPRASRDNQNRLVNLVYLVDEGTRVYIERINVRGNTRTRDYVIRREFDIGEGDAYNRALVGSCRASPEELELLQDGENHARIPRAPDRIILNVDLEEQSTGEFLGVGWLLHSRRFPRGR